MAPELDRLPASADRASILEVIDRDGAVILENFLSEARVDDLKTVAYFLWHGQPRPSGKILESTSYAEVGMD